MAASNSSNSSLFPISSSCLFDKRVYDEYCLIPALFIITILAFLNKRVRIKPKVCGGRPGLVLPINFLGDNTNNRLSIAVAFGVIAGSCFQIFNDLTGFVNTSFTVVELGNSPWEKAFRSVVWVLLYGIINFPIFACLMTNQQFIGACFGFSYTLMRLITEMVLLFSCPSPYIQAVEENGLNPVFKHSEVFQRLPDLVCYLFLLARFSVLLLKEFYRRYRRHHAAEIESVSPVIAKAHDYAHVRLLLNNKLIERLDNSSSWCMKIRKCLYKPRPDFKFSTEIASTLTVSVIFIYRMTVSLVIIGALFMQVLSKYRKELEHEKDRKLFVLKKFLVVLSDILAVSYNVSAFASAFFSVLMMLHFIKCHSKIEKLLNRYSALQTGEHVLISYKTKKFLGNSPSRLVGRSLSYPGYQIAYIGWGYIIIAIILLIISISIGIITKAHWWDYVYHLIVRYLLPVFVVPICVWIFQYLLGLLVFRDRRFPDVAININNHRFYCVMSFFFFFFNILVGWFSSIFRLLKSALLGIVFLSRIDRSPLMMGYQKWDKGYMSYIGFLSVLKSFSHPVMLVFCQLLVDQRQYGSRHPLRNNVFVGDTSSHHVIVHNSEEQECSLSHPLSKAAANRWLVAYSLLKNPDLQKFRKRSLRLSYLTTLESSSTDVSSSSLLIT